MIQESVVHAPPAACGPSPGSSEHEQRFLGSSQTHQGSSQCQIFNPARGHELEATGQLHEWEPHHQSRRFFYFVFMPPVSRWSYRPALPKPKQQFSSFMSHTINESRTNFSGFGPPGQCVEVGCQLPVRCRDQQGDPEPTRFSTKCSAITPGKPPLLPEGRSRCIHQSRKTHCND